MSRWLRRLSRWIGLAIVALAVTWPLATFGYRRAFDADVEALRENGVRIDLAQFNPPETPDRENAAVVLRSGMQWCEECGLDLDERVKRWRGAPDAEKDEAWRRVEHAVTEMRPWFARVERAIAMEQCAFHVDYGDEFAPSSEPGQTTRFIRDSLYWRVRVRVEADGSIPTSIADCETLLRWGAKIDPVFVASYGQYLALHRAACRMIRTVARQPGFVAAYARGRLEPLLLAAERDEGRMREVVDSELARAIATVRLWTNLTGTRELSKRYGARLSEQVIRREPDHLLAWSAVLRRPFILRRGTQALDVWSNGSRILARDDLESLAELRALVQTHRSAHDPETSGFEALETLQQMRVGLRAQLRFTRAGLAALEHHARHGAWPTDAGGILDPLTGKPVRLRVQGGSLIVGATHPKGESRVVWALGPPRPPK